MYFTPTIFITQLLAAMQVLMTLDMPLSTTMALPVTSKPIESTVENLAWQAWIDLPPEQKQQVKSRKVTPKSIFTLPNRIDCPEGHKQVDTKCIPLVIGTNANLVAAQYLTIIAGNSPTDKQYDYDDYDEEVQFSFNPQMQIGEAEKSVDGLTVELKPPSKDEPLKFNIFENKFNIYHEEPFEDYLASISNEASGSVPSAEKDGGPTVNLTLTNTSSNSTVNVTVINDGVSGPTNVSESTVGVTKSAETITTDNTESNTMPTVSSDNTDFKVNAISLPASGFELQRPHKLSMFQTDPSIQLITTIMDPESETLNKKEQQQQPEHDIQTLLQTDSLLPLIHPATATTLLSSPMPESSSLTAVVTDDLSESSSNSFNLNIENVEEMTTTPNIMEQEMETRGDKVEYTRSVTFNPLISDNGDTDKDDVNETTLESIMNDEPLETTTTYQVDDTTIMENIETSASLYSYSSPADSVDLSTQQDLKELLIKQEQAIKDFEELQRMRKGHKDQPTVLKKSKVEPVEVLSTTTTTTTTRTTDLPTTIATTTTTTMDELITAETVTPLLTVHNENDNNNNNNNDRFYYQHFAKQDLEETLPIASTKQRTSGDLTLATATTATTTTSTTAIEAMPATKTSEIDLAEELRVINELVKGITPAKITTNIKTKIPTTETTPTTTTTEIITSLTDVSSSSSSPAPNLSESSTYTIEPTLSTSQIWSKLMPLLTRPQQPESLDSRPSTTQETSQSATESSNENFESSTTSESSTSNRSNRNSKIIRINGFNNFSFNKPPPSSTTTTTTTEEPSTSSTITPTADSYWWLPVAWRLDKSSTTETQRETEVNQEDQPLLLRFWSAYHAPKSS